MLTANPSLTLMAPHSGPGGGHLPPRAPSLLSSRAAPSKVWDTRWGTLGGAGREHGGQDITAPT